MKVTAAEFKSVAAQVAAETTPQASSIGLTEREAEENSSVELTAKEVYRFVTKETRTMMAAKPSPRPQTIA